MMNQAPGAINFTMFLTLFGERLQGTDPEDVIKNAFACFDDNIVGTLNEDYLRELLTTLGDRFTQDEVDDLYKEAPIKNGHLTTSNSREFSNMVPRILTTSDSKL